MDFTNITIKIENGNVYLFDRSTFNMIIITPDVAKEVAERLLREFK